MSKMTKIWWIGLYIFSGGMDFIQLVIIEGIFVWLAGSGPAANEVLDPIVGMIIGGVLAYKKVPLMSRPKRIMALLAGEAAAAISAGVAQFWILSVWYIHTDVRTQEAGIKAILAEEEFIKAGMRAPAYTEVDGVASREPVRPSATQPPHNLLDNVRRPNGGLNPAV